MPAPLPSAAVQSPDRHRRPQEKAAGRGPETSPRPSTASARGGKQRDLGSMTAARRFRPQPHRAAWHRSDRPLPPGQRRPFPG